MSGMHGSERITCPSCGGAQVQKYGKTSSGKQKYRCLAQKCRRQFVGDSTHLVDSKTKEIAIRLIKENVRPTTIVKSLPGISLSWVRELRRKVASL